MKHRQILFVIVALLAGALALSTQSAQTSSGWKIEGVLGMMDKSAQDFHTLTADIEHIKYTAVVKDTSTETGHIFVRKDDKMRIEFVNPDPRTILRLGESLFLFNPKINRVEEYDLGKNKALVDQYVRLGFGTRADDLRKSYLVSVMGEEELDHKKAVVLELTPKSEQVRNQILKIQMWVDEASWLPIQQKFFEAGSGDYFLFHYTNAMKNLKIGDAKFKQDWPKNVTRVKPRG
ncbi:MAG TPA: outer membrane lipoprotein-sorting protein [Methylomirabilota bacterium]|nr:outer membrane lipoprotein-sorting protein [Methylomirabilota bacterium]